MKIKLLYVPRRYTSGKYEYAEKHTFTPPLGIAVLTAALRKHGFSAYQDDLDAKVFFDNWNVRPKVKYRLDGFDDARRIRCFLESGSDAELEEVAGRILRRTRLRGYDTVGLSTCGQHNISSVGVALALAKLVREQHGCTTILGGLDLKESFIPPEALVNSPYLDFVVSGHAESTFLNLCHAIEHDELGEYHLGDVFWKQKVESHKEPPYVAGKREFILPQFGGLPLDLYRYHPLRVFEREEVQNILSGKTVLMLPYYFMMGCPLNCAFCGESFTQDHAVKPVRQIVEELAYLKKRYRSRHFLFLNTMVNPSQEFARELAQGLIDADLDIRWSDCAHLGCLDRPLVRSLKEAGAVRLIYGLESGSERLLRYVQKGFTPAQARNVLKWAHEQGIWNEVDVICGLPTERQEDVNMTARFLIEQQEYINYYHLSRFQLKHSRFLLEPGLFGLNGISRVEDAYYTHRFDESGGLVWRDKRAQISRSYERLTRQVMVPIVARKGMRLYNSNTGLSLLFYLYDLLDDKPAVEAIIHSRGATHA